MSPAFRVPFVFRPSTNELVLPAGYRAINWRHLYMFKVLKRLESSW